MISIPVLATAIFGLAVVHTFASSLFRRHAAKYREGTVAENFFHLIGEVEIVFGLWAGFFLVCFALLKSPAEAIAYAEHLNYTEPLFVFAIMTVAATKPVIQLATRLIFFLSRLIPMNRKTATYCACLAVGPLLGSFITEPAAMTVTAMILQEHYFEEKISERFKYLTLGVLFVNVSIGGALTPYAAPPVLMVAKKWNWDLAYMLTNFGWKTALAVLLNSALAGALLGSELKKLPARSANAKSKAPLWLTAIHLAALFLIVSTAHHAPIFMGLFLFFVGLFNITKEYQEELKLKESVNVAFFLSGLVVLGGMQRWWLEPLLQKLNALPLFLGATALTSITDNAALTYLGSQIRGISPGFQYALVAGAIAGGGLTVIANAPNPAGYAILQERFGKGGINALKLALAALVPTLIGMGCLWFLR